MLKIAFLWSLKRYVSFLVVESFLRRCFSFSPIQSAKVLKVQNKLFFFFVRDSCFVVWVSGALLTAPVQIPIVKSWFSMMFSAEILDYQLQNDQNSCTGTVNLQGSPQLAMKAMPKIVFIEKTVAISAQKGFQVWQFEISVVSYRCIEIADVIESLVSKR